MYLSEAIFYDSLGIGIQIRGGAKSALWCPRIWLPKFDLIILEAIAYKVNGGIQIRGGSKEKLTLSKYFTYENDKKSGVAMPQLRLACTVKKGQSFF